MVLLRQEEEKSSNCSVKALFAQSEKAMQMKAMEKQVRLNFALSCDYIIRGNPEQLLIVLNNLIDNAIKASEAEGEVRICVYPEEAHMVVEVKDAGIGMEPEQLSHIKEAFYRVDKARSRAAGGAGLGLAICEKILKLHHADLSFASKPGSGTVVKILFPVE